MAFFKWYQLKGGDESWSLMLAEHEERLIREKSPAFTTILAADNDFKGEMDAEAFEKVHYTGPLYFDFDASSIDEVIPQLQKFLGKLKNTHDFDLNQAAIYASGGKGFHVIIDPRCFIAKVSPKGYVYLPAIYREVAMELLVDCLDMRVYTARKGRMFRTANVERPDRPGVHKVPITVEEAFTMTPELYKEICSAPRHVAPPAAPELNPGLALLFASAQDKVDKASKGRKKSKVDVNLLKKFGGDFPPSILGVMSGEIVSSQVGFQKIALQLALAAHSLGKSEDVFLTLCEGLCQNHQSDGTRYNTPAKRRNELSRMYHYMKDNPCYDFSVGGIKACITKDTATPDLDNGGVELEEEANTDELDYSIAMGMKISESGLWRKTEEGLQRVCVLGFGDAKLLVETVNGENAGYDVEVFSDGRSIGRRLMRSDSFLSRQKLMQFTLSIGGASVNATDGQVGALADIMRIRAARSGNMVYATYREGVDVVVLPDGRVDLIWIDKEGAISRCGEHYRLRAGLSKSNQMVINTDLRKAPELVDSPKTRQFFENFFHINSPNTLARLYGWMFSTFISQIIRHQFNQYPMVQVFGAAGAGKTQTVRLLASMHYWRQPVPLHTGGGNTAFMSEALYTSSASVPVIIDEVKPREMGKIQLDRLKMNLRGNYNSAFIGKGGLNRDNGSNDIETRGFANSAPLICMGEALESQAAILDRTVLVSMTSDGRQGKVREFDHCIRNKEVLASLGRNCISHALGADFERITKLLQRYKYLVLRTIGNAKDSDRQAHNLAVVLLGLEFGRQVMAGVFGTRFNANFQTLKRELIGQGSKMVVQIESEASQVLAVLAHLSEKEDANDQYRLELSVDYMVAPGELHLNLRNCYTKYARFQRAQGSEVLYDNINAFISAMRNFPAIKSENAAESPLKVSFTTLVFSFDSGKLVSENIPLFKGQSD